jgi:hypothetical protein
VHVCLALRGEAGDGLACNDGLASLLVNDTGEDCFAVAAGERYYRSAVCDKIDSKRWKLDWGAYTADTMPP